MRHEKIVTDERLERLDSLEIAAVWPSSAQVAPMAFSESELGIADFAPTPAAPDVPSAVGGLLALAYGAVILALFVATAGSAFSIFMITVSALFVVVFFTVPRIFFAIEPQDRPRTGFQRFLAEGMETLTGHSSGRAALVQMLIVPVFLAFGILVMGIAAAYYL